MSSNEQPGGTVRVRGNAPTAYRERFLSNSVFDDSRKAIFLDFIAENGRVTDACRAAGVSSSTVRRHVEMDPDFAEAYDHAKQAYADYVTSVVERRALDGTREPIMGGRFKDQVVGHKVVYETPLTIMHAKRYVPEYRDRQQVDVSVTGGVLAVASALPGTDSGQKDWNAMYGGEYTPGSIECVPPPKGDSEDAGVEEQDVAAGGAPDEGACSVVAGHGHVGEVGEGGGPLEDQAGPPPGG